MLIEKSDQAYKPVFEQSSAKVDRTDHKKQRQRYINEWKLCERFNAGLLKHDEFKMEMMDMFNFDMDFG